MTAKEFLSKNEDYIRLSKQFKSSKIYDKIKSITETQEYKAKVEYLKQKDKIIHKDILEKIEKLQARIEF